MGPYVCALLHAYTRHSLSSNSPLARWIYILPPKTLKTVAFIGFDSLLISSSGPEYNQLGYSKTVRTENQIDPAEFTLPAAIVTLYRLALAAQGSLKTYTGLLLIERL
jgi:hypothetical protein